MGHLRVYDNPTLKNYAIVSRGFAKFGDPILSSLEKSLGKSPAFSAPDSIVHYTRTTRSLVNGHHSKMVRDDFFPPMYHQCRQ